MLLSRLQRTCDGCHSRTDERARGNVPQEQGDFIKKYIFIRVHMYLWRNVRFRCLFVSRNKAQDVSRKAVNRASWLTDTRVV